MEAEVISPNPFLGANLAGGYAGTVLLHRDLVPLAAGGNRAKELSVAGCGSVGGHIYADQACTMKFYTSPDGDNYGAATELAVAAGQTVPFEYLHLFSRTVKIEVVNGAAPMAAFRLYVRGGA